jgi:threonine/homoserine/homoserine lactone efflux protein
MRASSLTAIMARKGMSKKPHSPRKRRDNATTLTRRSQSKAKDKAYYLVFFLSVLPIFVNAEERSDLKVVSAVIIAAAINAAINEYSMAVAPDSLSKKDFRIDICFSRTRQSVCF